MWPPSCASPDAPDAVGADLQGAQHQQEASLTQDLSLPAERAGNHPAQPGPPLGIMLRMTLPGNGCADIPYIRMERGFLYLVAKNGLV